MRRGELLFRGALVGACGLLSAGCEDTPEKAYTEIQSAACDADVGLALKRIHVEEFRERHANNLLKFMSDATGQSPLPEKVLKAMENDADEAIRRLKDDVAKGPSGKLCQATLVAASRDEVQWRQPDELVAGKFTKYDGRWQLVQLTYPDRLERAKQNAK